MTFKVGQRVWIYDVNNRRSGRGPDEGHVTKIGRKYVHVESSYGATNTFDIVSGNGTGTYGHLYWIKTDEQRATAERRAELLAELKAAGIRLDSGTQISDTLLERLAATTREEVES